MSSYRLWGSTENGDVEFESLTTKTYEGALKVIRESFFTTESVSIGVDLLSEPGAAEELEELCLVAARDGVSIVAVEVATGSVVAVAFNKIQIRPPNGEKSFFEDFAENCKCNASRKLVDFMVDVDAKIDLFEHHNVDTILEIMFLVTSPSHGRRRLGELLVSASVEIARQLKLGNDVKIPVDFEGLKKITNKDATPQLCSALCTSNYSFKICNKLCFDTLYTVFFDDYEFNGKKFSERIGDEHKVCKLVAKRLFPR